MDIMNRRRLVILIVIAVMFAALLPISTLTAPEWSVCVLDESGNPAANVLVRESYENYSAEFEGNEEDLYTDTKGCVFFLPKRVRSSLLKRFGAIISSAMSGAHASFGPHSNVTAFQGKQRGDDVRRGLLFTWEGSPAHMSSVLRLQNQ